MYKWAPIFRFTPNDGNQSVMSLATAFPDTEGPLSNAVDYRIDQEVDTDVNRGRAVLFRGFRPTVRMTFEVFTATHQTSLATIVNRLCSPHWTVELSMDGGIIWRAVTLARLDGPDALAGKTFIGARWTLTVEAVDLIGDYPDMNADDGALELNVDPGFEAWNTATDPTHYDTEIGGGSINQEASIFYDGANSLRADRVGAGNLYSYMAPSNVVFLKPGLTYRVSVACRLGTSYNTAFGPYLYVYHTLPGQSGAHYLQTSGVWQLGGGGAIVGGGAVGAWTVFTKEFKVPDDHVNPGRVQLACAHASGNGTSIYYDALSLVGPVRPTDVRAW